MADPVQSLDAIVNAEFGGEVQRFRLTVPFLEKVERDCDAGAGVIAGELAKAVRVLEARRDGGVSVLAALAHGLGAWRSVYVRSSILWGLQGGGMSPNDASRLVRTYIDERGFMGLLENAELAFRVVTGAYFGLEDDPPAGEPSGAAETAPSQPKRKPRSRTAAPASR